MKKTYIAPGIMIETMQTADSMLAGSFDLNRTTVSGSSALSRESDGSFWDDDEDYGGSLWDDDEDY
jgi:hypothetical protein